MFIENLYKLLDGKCYTDYRHLHLIYEHKKMMLNKIEIISEYKMVDIENEKKTYGSILSEINLARMLFLKGLIMEKKTALYEQLNNVSLIKSVIQILESCVEREYATLCSFLGKVSE